MFEKFLKIAEQIVAEYKAQYLGVYEMKGGLGGALKQGFNIVKDEFGAHGWNGMRDAAETGAALIGDYYLPGSSLLTQKLASKGSQKELNTGFGKTMQAVSSAAGLGMGGSPSAGGAAETSALSSIGNGISSAAGSVGNALGITDAAGSVGTAAPWINPDTGVAAPWINPDVATTTTAAPWVNPDIASAPGASAASASPWTDPNAVTGVDALGNPVPNATVPTTNVANVPTSLSSPYLDAASAAPSTGTPLSTVVPTAAGLPPAAAPSTLSKIAPWISPAISAAGLGLSAMKGAQTGAPSEKTLNTDLAAQAGQEAASGQQLQNYLPSGTLPPGAQAGIDQAKNSAKAAVRSKYASMGMSGSSSEQQELSAIDSNAQAQGEQIAMQLLNTGITESQMSSQLYEHMLNNTMQNDQALSSAVSGFAGSLAGAANPTAHTGNVTSNV